MKQYNATTLLLVGGILLLLNLLSRQVFVRFDLTEDKQYTLSKATKDILKGLDDPVTVRAYFSEGLPPEYQEVRRDFQDMLVEYANLSKGMVEYEFINPNESPEKEQEALQAGIRPLIIAVREKDQSKQQKAFMGAVLEMGERSEVIPVLVSGTGMEYALSTGIKKLSVTDKPSVAILQGHGEPGLGELGQVVEGLSVLYNVETLDLSSDTRIPERFRAVAVVAPTDSIPESHLQALDDYLARGGRLFVAINRVQGDLQTAMGNEQTTGLEGWLRQKGIEVEPAFLVDAVCAPVTVQQRQGFFTINTQVSFPFLPILSNFAEHPITKGLEQVILPFASPLRWQGDSSLTFTPIAFSSEKAGTVKAPTFFDVTNKRWTDADFPLSNLPVGAVVEGNFGGELPGRLVVFGDGDFPVTGQGRGANPDNVNLMVNSMDWLSDDTGLIELRTKGVASRPIDEAFLGDENATKRNLIKIINFGLPILLVIVLGIVRYQRQRSIRLQRMQIRYA